VSFANSTHFIVANGNREVSKDQREIRLAPRLRMCENQGRYKPEWPESLLPIQPAVKSDGDPSHKYALSTGIEGC
jgi:hypothetical protein